MDVLQLILFSFILLYLLREAIQTKSALNLLIFVAGIGVVICKLFLNQFNSSSVQVVVATLTLILCVMSGWLLIRNNQ